MSKVLWKPGTLLYPTPVVMVSCGEIKSGTENLITIAWTGIINTNPAMTYVSIRKERHSFYLISETKDFVINLTTKNLAFATDFCGVKSGKDFNKFNHLSLTAEEGIYTKSPILKESPVNIECKVKDIIELGSHHMFLGEVLGVQIDECYLDDKGKFHFERTNPICYSHGEYYTLGDKLGHFGYSVKKNIKKKKHKK